MGITNPEYGSACIQQRNPRIQDRLFHLQNQLGWNRPQPDQAPEDLEEASRRIVNLAKPSLAVQWKSMMQLRHGKGENVTERIEQMTTREILMDIPLYQDLLQEGIEKGRKEGKAEGKTEGTREILTGQLQARFGALPDWASEKINAADLLKLQRWSQQLLSAPDLSSALE